MLRPVLDFTLPHKLKNAIIMEDNCLKTTDFENKTVVFVESQRAIKAKKHPELRDPAFIAGRVRDAVCTPSFVYADLGAPLVRRAHYLKEFVVNGSARYTKVIVDISLEPRKIISAFRPDCVKENGKTELLYGKDE